MSKQVYNVLCAVSSIVGLACGAPEEPRPEVDPAGAALVEASSAVQALGVGAYSVQPEDEGTRVVLTAPDGARVAELFSRWGDATHWLSYESERVRFDLERTLDASRVYAALSAGGTVERSDSGSTRALLARLQGELGDEAAHDLALLGAVTDDIVFADTSDEVLEKATSADWPFESAIPGRGFGQVNRQRTRVRACDTEGDNFGVRTRYEANGVRDLVGDANGSRGGCGEEGSTGGPPVASFRAAAGPNGEDRVRGPLVVF